MANEGQLWMTIGADNTQFARTAKDTNKRLNEMSQNVKAFSQGITSSFVEAAKSMAGFYSVAKAGSMFQSLIEKNDQFNKSMREVSTLSEEVANNLDSYKKQILDMTTQIPIGADEAAKALYQINSAGHTGADGMRVLEASAKAAIGGVTETVTAADTITTVLNAYKMSSAEAASVSDKLFTAVKLGKTSMSELGASIAQVAPVAASFGVSIDQVLGAIATLTKNGTPTAQAVTQIRAAIVSLSSALGSTYFETHTLQQGMNDIREAIPDNNQLKQTLGTIEAVNAVLAMTGKNASGAAEDLREFENSAGAAGKAYDKMNTGKGTELTKLQNNIMKEMADINNEISETITTLARKINEAFDSGDVEDYINTFKELITVYGIYKGVAIATAAAQTAYSKIVETSQEAAMAQLRQVIAMKEAEATAEGQAAAAKTATLTGREAEIAALQEEAAATIKALKAKAEEAAVNLKNAKSEQAMAQARLSSAQTGVAMREQELAAAIASGDGLKIETAEIELQKAALEENAAARRLKAANAEVEAATTAANTTATAAETAVTTADTAATVADTAATGFLTKAKIALSAAITKVTAAMAANPFTAALVAVVALGYAVYKGVEYFNEYEDSLKGVTSELDHYGRTADEAKKATDELNDTYAKINAGIKESVAKLKTFKGSKEDEKKLIKECNDKYGEAMGYYNSVNEWYKALTQNSAKYCQQMKNEALIRQLANQAAENEQKIHDIKYNEDGSEKKYSKEMRFSWSIAGTGGSEYDVAMNDIKKLEKANEEISNRMQALLNENNKITEEIYQGSKPNGGNETPQGKNKAYWQGEIDKVDKAIADLDTEDKNFKKKKQELDKQKKAYQAQLRKFDDPDKGKDKQDKLKEQLERQKETQAELYQELLEMRSKNNDDEIALMKDGHNKRMKEIDSEYDKELNEVSKMALKWAKENKNAGLKSEDLTGSVEVKGTSYKGLTQEQQKELGDAIANAQAKMQNSTEALYKEEEQMANDYLKEYGTVQEQRYAIAKEWDDKITNLELTGAPEAAIKKANRDKSKALANFDFEQVKKDINWEYIFGDLDNVNTETLKVVNDQLKEFMANAEGLEPDQLKTIVDAMSRIQDKMDLTAPIATIKKAREEYALAKKEYDSYAKDLAVAEKNGNIAGQKTAKQGMLKADQKITKAQNKEKKAYYELTGAVNNYAQALKEAGEFMGGATGECLKLGASAIQAGVGMANGIKAFGNAVGAMEKSVAILAIIEAALQAIQMITELFGDSADQTLTNYVATMDTYLKLLKDNINDVSDAMKNNRNLMTETVAYYEKLIELQKKQAMGIKSQSQTWLNSGASKGFLGIGSSSSEGVKIVKQMKENMNSSNEEVKRFYQTGYNQLNKYYKDVYGVYAKSVNDFGRLDWIWRLSDDDLRALSQDTEAMAMLGDDLSGAINQYVQAVGSATDALEDEFEALLTVSYDDFYDEFTDMIKDMDNDAYDFSQNFGEYMYNALVKNMIAQKYKTRLEKLYKTAGEYADDGTLDKHLDELRQEYTDIAQEAARDADTLAKITGVMMSESQKATANAIQNITADQADQLVGRITAMQIAVEANKDSILGIVTQISQVAALSTQSNAYLSDMLSQHALSNSYLEDIAKYSKAMSLELEGRMQKLVDNTSRL